MESPSTVAVGIICKTPRAGRSKTRLSPPLSLTECAEISGCFIGDLAASIASLDSGHGVSGYAVYTPQGSEEDLRSILPDTFDLLLQGEGDLGSRLNNGLNDLLALGHAGAILVNSDSPTLPAYILEDAAGALRQGEAMVISPAIDGGYTFIGLTNAEPRLFADIPWSTPDVLRLTLERARALGIEPVILDPWYDVDDWASYAILEAELSGQMPSFARRPVTPQDAPRTRRFTELRRECAS